MLQTSKTRLVWAPKARYSYGSYNPSRTKIVGYKLDSGFSRIHMVTFHMNTCQICSPTRTRKEQALAKIVRVNIGHFLKKKLMRPFVSVTSHDTKNCDTDVYTSFFQLLIRRKQSGNWPNTYAKRLQNLANMTLAKRLVGETTVNPLIDIVCLFCIVSNHSFRW